MTSPSAAGLPTPSTRMASMSCLFACSTNLLPDVAEVDASASVLPDALPLETCVSSAFLHHSTFALYDARFVCFFCVKSEYNPCNLEIVTGPKLSIDGGSCAAALRFMR